ncbi:MAG: hypothetical protein U0807_03570 [Candidatus Binatia bacterium]
MQRAFAIGVAGLLTLVAVPRVPAFTLEELSATTGIHDAVAGTAVPNAASTINGVRDKLNAATARASEGWAQGGESTAHGSGAASKAWATGGGASKSWASPAKSGASGGAKGWATASSKGSGSWATNDSEHKTRRN